MKFFKKLYAKFHQSKEKNLPSLSNSKTLALSRLKEIHNYDYTTFVARHYRSQNYTVWEYSKEKNLIDHPFNLVVKIKKNIVLISCRSNKEMITKENIRDFERRGKEFIDNYRLFRKYNIRYLYACPENNFTNEAWIYLQENNHLDFKILKEFEEEVA